MENREEVTFAPSSPSACSMASASPLRLSRAADAVSPWPTAATVTVAWKSPARGRRETLLDQWQRYYDEIERAPDTESVDVDGLLVGMEKVMQFHLDSEGMK